METEQSFGLYISESKNLNITITNKNTGQPYDLTSCVVTWHVKRSTRTDTDLVTKSSADGGIEIVDSVNGKIKVKLTGTDTTTIGIGKFHHYAWIMDVLNEGTMLLTGTMEIKEK